MLYCYLYKETTAKNDNRVALYGKMSTIHKVCMKSLSCEAYVKFVSVSKYIRNMPHTNKHKGKNTTAYTTFGIFILLLNIYSVVLVLQC